MKTRLRISDHALVRYTERVLDTDLQPLRDRIARDLEAALDDWPGDVAGVSAVLMGGYRYVIDNGIVVTVHEISSPDIRTGLVRGRRGERDG